MDTLEQLMELSSDELHQHAKMVTTRLDTCLYLVGLALLASERTRSFLKRHCSDTVQYAVNHLGMARQKANELLRATRVLADLPILREAFRTGQLGWGKIRDLTRVATPETDQQWLEYALAHTTDEVQRAVTMSPRAYAKNRLAANQPRLVEDGPGLSSGGSAEGPEQGGPAPPTAALLLLIRSPLQWPPLLVWPPLQWPPLLIRLPLQSARLLVWPFLG